MYNPQYGYKYKLQTRDGDTFCQQGVRKQVKGKIIKQVNINQQGSHYKKAQE